MKASQALEVGSIPIARSKKNNSCHLAGVLFLFGVFFQRNGDFHIVRKVISRNGDGSAMTDADGKVIYEALSDGGADKINGRQLILDKLQMVREWMMSAFNIDIDAMRDEIQRRQYATNEDGSFKFDDWGRYVNALTSPSASDPSRTVMEVLLDEVNQYKALQTK